VIAGSASEAGTRDDGAGTRSRASAALSSSAGRNAVAFAVADTERLRDVRLRIVSEPGQWVTAVWVVTCHRGLALETKDGSASGRSPLVRDLSLPLARPDRCSIFGGGQLEGTGRISVDVTARSTHPSRVKEGS
jgi:hypothetical protein